MAPKVGVDSHQRTLGASMAATTSGAAVATTPTTGPSTSSSRPSSHHHHHHQRVSPRKSASATLALRPKPPKKNVRFTDKNDVTLVMCLDEVEGPVVGVEATAAPEVVAAMEAPSVR